MANEGQPLVEDVSLRDNIDLYSELQYEIIWLQGEIAKLTDGNPCKPALIAMLESLEKKVKDFKEAGHEEDVWERIQLAKRASVEGTVKQVELKPLVTKQQCWDLFAQEPKARSKMKVNRLKNMQIAPYVYRRFVVAHGCRPNHDEIPQYYV